MLRVIFRDYFNRKTFDVGYYIDMGSLAYGNVSTLMRAKNEHKRVYSELSKNFTVMVDVVQKYQKVMFPLVTRMYLRYTTAGQDPTPTVYVKSYVVWALSLSRRLLRSRSNQKLCKLLMLLNHCYRISNAVCFTATAYNQ